MVTNKKAIPKLVPLSMVDIVMRADVETIRAALEARQKIDALLAERAAAYERIAALEAQIDEVIGGPDQFVFPPPPVPVAAYAAVASPVASPKASSEAKAESEEVSLPFEEKEASRPESEPAVLPEAHDDGGHGKDSRRKGNQNG